MKNDRPRDFREVLKKPRIILAWKKKAKQLREQARDLQKVIDLREAQLSSALQRAEDEPSPERLLPKETENIELKIVIEELLVFDAAVRVHGFNAAPFDRARSVLDKYK